MIDNLDNIKSVKKFCYSIDDVSGMYSMNPWTIRMWVDRFRILEHRIDSNGYMLFTQEAVERIGRICQLVKTKNLKLEDIQKHLESDHCGK